MINKSSRLTVLDGLREGAMQEHILHIELMNGPGAGDSQEEHGADHGRLDHRAKGLIVVNAGSLGEAAKDLGSLVPFQIAVRVQLVLQNPFAGVDVGANGQGIRSHVLLVIKEANSSSMARRQFGSTRAVQTEEGTGDKFDAEVTDRVTLSTGSQKPRFTHVVIG
jgi:hypothetical protein